ILGLSVTCFGTILSLSARGDVASRDAAVAETQRKLLSYSPTIGYNLATGTYTCRDYSAVPNDVTVGNTTVSVQPLPGGDFQMTWGSELAIRFTQTNGELRYRGGAPGYAFSVREEPHYNNWGYSGHLIFEQCAYGAASGYMQSSLVDDCVVTDYIDCECL